MTLLKFLLDVCEKLSVISKFLQKTYGVVPGQRSEISKLVAAFENLKIIDSTYLLSFLSESKCQKEFKYGRCTKEDLDSNKLMLYKETTLSSARDGSTRKNIPLFSEIRMILCDEMKGQLDAYFPEGDLNILDSFYRPIYRKLQGSFYALIWPKYSKQ